LFLYLKLPTLLVTGMLLLHHYLVASALLQVQHVAALPQGLAPSETSSEPSATPLATALADGNRTCDFDKIDDFFSYANKNGLNITVEVQHCQNLCLLTYGTGNPDLSGIGVSPPYSRLLQKVLDRLTVFFPLD
jgi:hypothetical protein